MNKSKNQMGAIDLYFSKHNVIFDFLKDHIVIILIVILSLVSVIDFIYFSNNGLALAYNDARSHLDIGRRVVENLKPGVAQIGSVWLPLQHLLMIPTIWNNFFWHTGLSGAIQSMISFVFTGILIYLILKELNVCILGRIIGVAVFITNLNILYLQSTAMTELLLIATSTAACFSLIKYFKYKKIFDLILVSFWIMLSSLARYDGWFLFAVIFGLLLLFTYTNEGYKQTEGKIILFSTLGGVGIALWFLWNLIIFGDPLYFALGPFSAHTQQLQLLQVGDLPTKGNILLSIKIYLLAFIYNTGVFNALLCISGALMFWLNKNISNALKLSTISLITPLFFNIIALYLGFSVVFIQGVSGNTWFNVRYGIMLIPFVSVFIGYLLSKAGNLRFAIIFCLVLVTIFSFSSFDAVTVDDAKFGASQKNVTEVSSWLNFNAKDKPGFILISAASHDAIIFSSGLDMSRFIHEGTGDYWVWATNKPDKWARWIVMRTYDLNDLTYFKINNYNYLKYYDLVGHFPFADIYQIKNQYLSQLNTKPVLEANK